MGNEWVRLFDGEGVSLVDSVKLITMVWVFLDWLHLNCWMLLFFSLARFLTLLNLPRILNHHHFNHHLPRHQTTLHLHQNHRCLYFTAKPSDCIFH